MRPKAIGIVLLLALTGTACAGDVVRYHNAPVAADGVTIVAGNAAAAVGGAGEVAASVPTSAPDAAVTDTTAASDSTTTVTEGGVPATQASTALSVTPTSGPAARYSRQAASSPAGGNDPARVSSPGASAPGTANGPGTGSSPPASSAGGVGPAPTPTPSTGGTTVGLTKDTITLGVFYPRTGAYTGLARNAPAVADAAFQEAGPINGRRVVIKYYDDGTANASTIQVEEKRAKDEVFSLMSIVSESNVVLAPLADQHKVPVFVGNIDRKVALSLTYAFPLYPFWARQATILPSFIKNSLNAGSRKIGVVFEGTSTAIDAKNAFKDKAKELGLNVVFEQPIAQNQSTCANEVANLQSHAVEVVYMMNGPLGGICMLRDARALGYKPMWTGVSPSWGFNVVAQASGGGADGIRMLRATPTLESPEGRHYTEIMRRYAPNSGAENDDLLLIFYALLRNVIEGLRQAGPNLTRESLVQTWETKMNGYDSGYLPPATFGPGNRSGPVSVGVAACCTDGKWTTPQQGWRATF